MPFKRFTKKTDQEAKPSKTEKIPGASLKEKFGKISFSKFSLGNFLPTPRRYQKGSRFVFFIGDDGTILLYMKGSEVVSRQFVPDASKENLEELRISLDADLEAPISLVVDNFDQTYVQQTLPPVSPMSVKKLMKRRLDRDFGANDIKGALLLGREKTGRKDWNFLMVSVEKSPQIAMWLDFVGSLPNRFLGIYLVSIEAEVVLRNLEHAMGTHKASTSKWKFFVSHNKVGGFRQVVLRDGRIFFTRMAQPIGESTPEVIAGNIEQEMQSTIEYMKRLSFDPESGFDIHIIVGSAVKPVIDKNKFGVSNFNIMTPYEAAQYLGIEGATQPTDQFGDVILAASISANRKHVLTFKTTESRQFDLLCTISRSQRVAAAVLGLAIAGYASSVMFDLYNLYRTSDELMSNAEQRQTSLDNLKAEVKRSNLDVNKTGDIIALYQLLDKQKVPPLDFISKIETVITPPIVIKSYDWMVEDKSVKGATEAKPKTTAVLVLDLPEVPTIEVWRIFSKKLLTDLKDTFKGYDVSFTKVPGKFLEGEKMDITFDAPAVKAAPTNEVSEVQLTLREL